ncbi:MAG: S-layer homology domain-containing protein [Synergistaceae bacterium]|nr:S-layer homology domain-containing protein [Synergistaceae bacterium]
MKKFAALAALVAVVAFAAPVFAATNPFMDVPMNHWAYDAIGQLAAHGILSGYPDGTYKGKQPTTRYEMASALARALAVVDMTKASKQDVEMLKKLVVEFKDELEALGVKVAELDERVSLIEERLGGWKLSGVLRLDVTSNNKNEAPTPKSDVTLSRARLIIERWFGDPENPMHFKAIIANTGNGDPIYWKNFYVDIPFFFDSTLIVGRFGWDAEAKYYVDGTNVGSFKNTGGYFGMDSVLTDYDVDAIGFQKNFGLGSVKGYIAHEDKNVAILNADNSVAAQAGGAWEFFGMGEFQFNEHFGLDLGFKAEKGDNFEPDMNVRLADKKNTSDNTAVRFNNLWHIFAGLRFNFNEDVAFKAIYYHQKFSIDEWLMADDGLGGAVADSAKWREPNGLDDSSKHWAVMLDVNQNILKFTSAWLEYGQYDFGFVNENASAIGLGYSFAPDDIKYYRIVLAQTWNEKWATHVFYYGYDFDKMNIKPKEWGLGVQYTINPNATIGVNYMKRDWDIKGEKDDNLVRLRTQVTF